MPAHSAGNPVPRGGGPQAPSHPRVPGGGRAHSPGLGTRPQGGQHGPRTCTGAPGPVGALAPTELRGARPRRSAAQRSATRPLTPDPQERSLGDADPPVNPQSSRDRTRGAGRVGAQALGPGPALLGGDDGGGQLLVVPGEDALAGLQQGHPAAGLQGLGALVDDHHIEVVVGQQPQGAVGGRAWRTGTTVFTMGGAGWAGPRWSH